MKTFKFRGIDFTFPANALKFSVLASIESDILKIYTVVSWKKVDGLAQDLQKDDHTLHVSEAYYDKETLQFLDGVNLSYQHGSVSQIETLHELSVNGLLQHNIVEMMEVTPAGTLSPFPV